MTCCETETEQTEPRKATHRRVRNHSRNSIAISPLAFALMVFAQEKRAATVGCFGGQERRENGLVNFASQNIYHTNIDTVDRSCAESFVVCLGRVRARWIGNSRIPKQKNRYGCGGKSTDRKC